MLTEAVNKPRCHETQLLGGPPRPLLRPGQNLERGPVLEFAKCIQTSHGSWNSNLNQNEKLPSASFQIQMEIVLRAVKSANMLNANRCLSQRPGLVTDTGKKIFSPE